MRKNGWGEALGKIGFFILSILLLKNAFFNALTLGEMKTREELANPPPPGTVTIP